MAKLKLLAAIILSLLFGLLTSLGLGLTTASRLSTTHEAASVKLNRGRA
jgi:hypothetical protein